MPHDLQFWGRRHLSMFDLFNISDYNFSNASDITMEEGATHCHKPNCSWLSLSQLTDLQGVPPLLPNPELSGIGVILSFSITAYLTVILLIFHYITVYDPCRYSSKGHEYVNPVDQGILTFMRHRAIAWKPSRRFEYAMEKSVLILSDTQLVTGLAILIAGYSQLDCGITAYHWQIMVFIAWFSSFTFLSAMAFLEGYFQTNNSLRIIRVCFMCILASLLIVALIPTGSRNWLDLFGEGGGFYPSLSAACYFRQIGMASFATRGPRFWSMLFSLLVVGLSYIHSGIRLFDPTARVSRKYLRAIPGSYLKRFLYVLERKAEPKGLRATVWTLPYLLAFAAFSSARAVYDIAESMLLEIIWLAFAIAWGSIKVWNTRASAQYSFDGKIITYNNDVLAEDSWSFGQTLPLVLLLLPILSMAQAYLDNDAKAQGAAHKVDIAEKQATEASTRHQSGDELSAARMLERAPSETPDPRNSTSCSISRCNHHEPSINISRTSTIQTPAASSDTSCYTSSLPVAPPLPPRSPLRPISPFSSTHPKSHAPQLPHHPYHAFTRYPWYKDHIALLIAQTLMLGSFILFVQNLLSNVLGISTILRNRWFLIWIFAMIPLASFVHLAFWYLAGWVVCRWAGAEEWLKGEGRHMLQGAEDRWWKRVAVGQAVYWCLRLALLSGCLVFTFVLSAELAGPHPLTLDDG